MVDGCCCCPSCLAGAGANIDRPPSSQNDAFLLHPAVFSFFSASHICTVLVLSTPTLPPPPSSGVRFLLPALTLYLPLKAALPAGSFLFAAHHMNLQVPDGGRMSFSRFLRGKSASFLRWCAILYIFPQRLPGHAPHLPAPPIPIQLYRIPRAVQE